MTAKGVAQCVTCVTGSCQPCRCCIAAFRCVLPAEVSAEVSVAVSVDLWGVHKAHLWLCCN